MSRRIASTLGLLACALTIVVAPASSPPAQTSSQFPPEQLEALVAPYIGYPQPVLVNILDASQYPAAILTTASALQSGQPQPDSSQLPPSVTALLESEPEALLTLAANVQDTALLGAAYQTQPTDIWIAVGAAQARSMTVQEEPVPDQGGEPEATAPAPVVETEPLQPEQEMAAPAPESVAAPTYAEPTYYAPPPPNTVVVQEPTQAGYSGGAVAGAGAIGFGVGAVTGALLTDDDDDGDDDFDIDDSDIEEAYERRSDLQEDRQDYADEGYEQRAEDREEAYETRQADRSAAYEQVQGDREQAQPAWQTTSQENQASRQSAAQQQQVSRQEAQASRQASVQQRQTSRPASVQQGQGSRQAAVPQRQGRASSRSSVSGGGSWGPFASAGGSRSSGRRR